MKKQGAIPQPPVQKVLKKAKKIENFTGIIFRTNIIEHFSRQCHCSEETDVLRKFEYALQKLRDSSAVTWEESAELHDGKSVLRSLFTQLIAREAGLRARGAEQREQEIKRHNEQLMRDSVALTAEYFKIKATTEQLHKLRGRLVNQQNHSLLLFIQPSLRVISYLFLLSRLVFSFPYLF